MSNATIERNAKRDARMSVLESVRGHDSTVAHAWNHTDGRCPKCGCPQQVMIFCVPGSTDLPRVRGCELDGEHIHRLCQACRYPWIERPLDQAMLAEEAGEFTAESEVAALLAALADRSGGISLAKAIIATYRGWVIRFQRNAEEGTVTVTASAPVQQKGEPRHPDFPPSGATEGPA